MSNETNPPPINRKKRKKHTAEFKADTVALVLRSGKPAAHTARDLGLSENLVAKWVRLHLNQLDAKTKATDGLSPSEMAAEIKRLQGEVDHISEQRDILKKVLSILSSDENRKPNS